MGGSIFGMFQQQAPQYEQQTYSNDQIFQTAKNADQAMRDAYKNELLAQLRAGSYKNPEGVYSNVLNNQAKQQQMEAFQGSEQAPEYQSISYSG